MTQMEAARQGRITDEVRAVAQAEGLEPEAVATSLARGRVVIPVNPGRRLDRPCGIGEGLSVKVNANLGTSALASDPQSELEKLEAVLAAGADTVMDLSTGGDLAALRRQVLAHCGRPVGTVPIYQAALEATASGGAVADMTGEWLLEVIEQHAVDGVDFVTVHAGVTREGVELARKRRTGIVSRGGSLLACWMAARGEENPLLVQFDRLLAIARRYDLTLSLGDGLRPGCLADATDAAQLHELGVLGELVTRCRQAGVQAMVEGPGHLPLDQVAANVTMQKSICDGAPFYVLGPLVTDVAPGYDHITSAIGGAVAAMAGADFLCYVTPAEHLALPTTQEAVAGVVAARIAAHAADLVRRPQAQAWDDRMADARRRLDWEEQLALALDPEAARQIHARHRHSPAGGCSMCGDLCVFRLNPPPEGPS